MLRMIPSRHYDTALLQASRRNETFSFDIDLRGTDSYPLNGVIMKLDDYAFVFLTFLTMNFLNVTIIPSAM